MPHPDPLFKIRHSGAGGVYQTPPQARPRDDGELVVGPQQAHAANFDMAKLASTDCA